MRPHGGGPVLTRGQPLGEGGAAMILVHGRGAGPANIMELSGPLAHPSFTYLAPAASGGTWYPNSFMAEIASNEPGISSGIFVLKELLSEIQAAGVPRGRTILAGFSQGACLTCEFLARHPARYGAVLAFSGGLIGPPGTRWDTTGKLGGTPIFLGCSDVDAHVPKTRVDETADVLGKMGASVEKRIYPGMGHLINEDELAFARILVEAVGEA